MDASPTGLYLYVYGAIEDGMNTGIYGREPG